MIKNRLKQLLTILLPITVLTSPLMFAGSSFAAGNYDLSFFAGTGTSGAPTPGPATSSKLGNTYAIATDKNGNVYVGDNSSNEVYKVTPSGTLSIFAGDGTFGVATPGAATSSALEYPGALAVDGNGNVYIADNGSDQIYKVTAGGTLSVFAGTGASGAPTPGLATSSKLGYPDALAVDSSGNVYIGDNTNSEVERVTSSDTLSIFAGTGTSGAPTPGLAVNSKLGDPAGLAVAADGTLYIADTTNYEIEKIAVVASPTLSIFAGTGTSGAPTPGLAASSKLTVPLSVAVDGSGNVFIGDQGTHEVYKVTSGNVLSIFAGTGTGGVPTPGLATSSKLGALFGLSVNQNDDIYIADLTNHFVEKIYFASTSNVSDPSSGSTTTTSSSSTPTSPDTGFGTPSSNGYEIYLISAGAITLSGLGILGLKKVNSASSKN